MIPYTTKKFLLLGMHRQTAFKLLYDVLYITINRKNEQVKKHIIALNMSEYKSIIFFSVFFLYYIIMKPTNLNNDINAMKEARKPFNEYRSNLSCVETRN